MSYAERHSVTVTTDSDGDATSYSPRITGRVITIIYDKDDYDSGVDFAITLEATGEGLWTKSNQNSSATVAPRQAVHNSTGNAREYASGFSIYDYVVAAHDRVKIVIDEGGDTKSGTFTIIMG